jgi:O-antigen/teichoic acid export membrane protein
MKKYLSKVGNDSFSPLEIRGSVLARNTVLNFFGLALPLLVGFLTIPVVIHRLGTDRFGILSIVWVVVGYFGFFDLGLGRATTKFVAEALGRAEYEKVPRYFWTTVFFQGILGIFAGVVLALVTPFLVHRVFNIASHLISESKFSFYVMAFSFPVVMVSGSFRGLLEAGQRFDLVNYVKIPSNIVNYLAPLLGALLGLGLPGIMVLLAVSRVATLVVWVVISLRVFPILRGGMAIHGETIKPMLSFGGWLTVSNLVGPILIYLDRFFIGSILTMEALGYYSAPYEIVLRLGIIPQSLLITLFPAFSALEGRRDLEKTKTLYGRSVKYLFLSIGTTVVLLVLLARVFLKLWLGEPFALNSTIVFQVLAVGFCANALANIPFSYLQGIGRADITAKFHLMEMIFYVPLVWGLIRLWGINGAAAAWAIRVTADMILLFWGAWKFGKMDLSNLVENGMIRGAIAMSAYAFAGYCLMRLPWGGFGVMVLTFGFLVALWYCAFSRDERLWVAKRSREALKRQVST